MGTRGILGFIILGQRYAAYNHYDSYPEGLGKGIIEFILNLTPEGYATMVRLVAELTWVEWYSKPSPDLQDRYQRLGFIDLSISSCGPEEWYSLLYKMQGASALPAIQSGELKHMFEAPFEGGDWEWAYFIDFENRMLETWAYEILLDIVPFEKLVKDGVKRYLACLYRYQARAERLAWGEGGGEEEEEEEEEEDGEEV